MIELKHILSGVAGAGAVVALQLGWQATGTSNAVAAALPATSVAAARLQVEPTEADITELDAIASDIDAALDVAPADGVLRIAIEKLVANAIDEQALGDVSVLAAACSAVHCRVEFSLAHGERGGALASRLGLLLPDGTTSSFIPVHDGDELVATVVYLEFDWDGENS